MRSLFGGGSHTAGTRHGSAEQVPRRSSGWQELLRQIQPRESLRVLDIGPTSSANINFITGLGHSIYMANLVEEAARPEWMTNSAEDGSLVFAVDRFLAANLEFAGRSFDVVLLWDAADFLPAALLAPLFHRIYMVMQPGALLLAFFHSKMKGVSPAETAFYRYHLTPDEHVKMQRGGEFALQQAYNNRQIEALLKDFKSYRFFLAKDNLREVVATC